VQVRYETVPQACADQAEQVSKLGHRAQATVEVLAGAAEALAWERHARGPWEGPGTVTAAAGPLGTLLELLHLLGSPAAPRGVRITASGPIVAGELLLAIDGGHEEIVSAVSDLRRFLGLRGGTLSVRRLPAALLNRIAPWVAGDGARVLQALKLELDPSGILNPGLLPGT
jgi:hypothetical protein